MYKKKLIFAGALFLIVVFIRLFSANSVVTEQYYSTGLYPYIGRFLRTITGWLPFSIGDVIYGLVAVWLLWKAIKGIRALFKNQFAWQHFFHTLYVIVIALLAIYIVFNFLWGINYNRQGIARQLGLKMEKYSPGDLKTVSEVLLGKVNESKQAIVKYGPIKSTSSEIFKGSVESYSSASQKHPFLKYKTPSVKTSMWGWLGNYIGFTGYYNPFTGEAQVNTTVPKFLQPYTTCHEIAHQLGYAKEKEANFVGYLAASASKDSVFLYSVYLDLFLYANRNLYSLDSAAAKSLSHRLLPSVNDDLEELNNFYLRHQNPVEPVIRWMYGKYLQSNQQPSGMFSYNEVTGLLVVYYKKYKKL
jgi:hypothetical protein